MTVQIHRLIPAYRHGAGYIRLSDEYLQQCGPARHRQVLYLADPWYANAGAGRSISISPLPQLIQSITGSQFRITVFTASLVTLTLNAGAYISEIFRGSIESVNKGQMEAARSLGLSYAKSMQKIILPQAVRICLPSLCEPVHYHPEGFHDPLCHRFIRDHVPCEDLCGKNHGVLCDIHMGRPYSSS